MFESPDELMPQLAHLLKDVREHNLCVKGSADRPNRMGRPHTSRPGAHRHDRSIRLNAGGTRNGSHWTASHARSTRGKEVDAEAFLKAAQPLALDEKGTLKWYAIKIGAGKFGIFDTFANESGRNAGLSAGARVTNKRRII
jgi:hypothetical protein